MKKHILLLACLLFLSFNVETDFCKGFEDGFCEGWKDVKGQNAICPVTPICPIPPIDNDTYKGGYNAGFKLGRKKAED